MTDIQFHETRMGQHFYEHTVPELVRQLARLNENLERAIASQKEEGPAGADPDDNAPAPGPERSHDQEHRG